MSQRKTHPYPGRFICLEGVDGAGKTTQARILEKRLSRNGFHVLYTREPGGTPSAEKIRDLLLMRDELEPFDPYSELLLMMTSRLQHLEHTIRPALEQGTWVICDRFIGSTQAMQVDEHNLSRTFFKKLSQQVLRGLTPDLTLYLDLCVEKSYQRMQGHVEKITYFDLKDGGYHHRVRESFIRQCQTQANHYLIDADDEVHVVSERIYHHILKHLSF